jgi:hypothetical protein
MALISTSVSSAAAQEPPEGDPSSDTEAMVEPLTVAAETTEQAETTPVRYLSYQLSYLEADRAVAVLQTLGYKIVTYSAPAAGGGEGPAEIAKLEDGRETKPVVFRLLDPVSMSIVDDTGSLGGQVFTSSTSGIPHQRLLIAWTDPQQLQTLLALLHDQLDVPAKQILIEALVIELSRDRIRDLGFDYSASKDGNSVEFGVGAGGAFSPFTYTFTEPAAKTLLEFTGRITALVNDGEAEILSRPSVLVLDGRQARVKVGDKFPYVETTTTTFGETLVSDTKYIDVGIVLNLRPRASDDNSEVTMQVETQVSSSAGSSGGGIGPQVKNREVQTLVRVANDTPFIIAGLISQSNSNSSSGIPGLSKIPLLGKLFQRSSRSRQNTEVMVVIIPHVVVPEDRAFSYTIAKDAALFDRFDLTLFQNVYRVRQEDIWDLDFIRESAFYDCLQRTAEIKASEISAKLRQSGRTPVAASNTAGLATELRAWLAAPADSTAPPPAELTEQYIRLLEGKIPGEHIFVKRMLLEIVRRQAMADAIADDRIIFFEKKSDGGALLDVEPLAEHLDALDGRCETLEMLYATESGLTSGLVFDPPAANLSTRTVEGDDYLCEMRRRNCVSPSGSRWSSLGILLNKCYEWKARSALGGRQTSIDLLKNVLVLKRVLDLNPSLPLTLEAFHAGREVVFPTEDDLREARHLVDRETAQLFYETLDSYYAFERRIRRAIATLSDLEGERPLNCGISEAKLQRPTVVDRCSCEAAEDVGNTVSDLGGSGDVDNEGLAITGVTGDESAPVSIKVDYSLPAAEPQGSGEPLPR